MSLSRFQPQNGQQKTTSSGLATTPGKADLAKEPERAPPIKKRPMRPWNTIPMRVAFDDDSDTSSDIVRGGGG
jgi:hypothetical protein